MPVKSVRNKRVRLYDIGDLNNTLVKKCSDLKNKVGCGCINTLKNEFHVYKKRPMLFYKSGCVQ